RCPRACEHCDEATASCVDDCAPCGTCTVDVTSSQGHCKTTNCPNPCDVCENGTCRPCERACEECMGTECKDACGAECLVCQEDGTCKATCDPALCLVCKDGVCQSRCSEDFGCEKCVDGHCEDTCDKEKGERCCRGQCLTCSACERCDEFGGKCVTDYVG